MARAGNPLGASTVRRWRRGQPATSTEQASTPLGPFGGPRPQPYVGGFLHWDCRRHANCGLHCGRGLVQSGMPVGSFGRNECFMTAKIINGVAVAATVRAECRERVRRIVAASGTPPGLAVVLVGS